MPSPASTDLAIVPKSTERPTSRFRVWIAQNALSLVGVALLAIFIVIAIFLYQLSVGAFDTAGGSIKIIVAALSLFATAMTALVSLVGLLLKHSIDVQSEAARVAEIAKADAIAREAEDRLKLDCAIRAVQLFANTAGAPSLPIQQSGALFTLCSLRQYELTLALLEGLLVQKQVDSSTFARVLNIILMTPDERLQGAAVTMLSGYADQLLSGLNFDLPDCFLSGCEGRSAYVRDWAPTVMVKVILARKHWEWRDRRSAINAITSSITLLWEAERDDRIKKDTGAILSALLKIFYPKPVILYWFHENFETDVIAAAVAESKPSSANTRLLIQRLEGWALELKPPA